MPVPNDPQQPKVFDRFFRTLGNHLTSMHEAPQRAEHLHVEEVWRVEVIIVPVGTPLDTGPEIRLEQEFGDRGGVNDDHADSRSLRMISVAGVLSFTCVRLSSPQPSGCDRGREPRDRRLAGLSVKEYNQSGK